MTQQYWWVISPNKILLYRNRSRSSCETFALGCGEESVYFVKAASGDEARAAAAHSYTQAIIPLDMNNDGTTIAW